MAEPVNGGNSNPGQPPKELSMELRLLIAFLLMGVVMFVTPYLPFFKNAAPPAGNKPPETTAAPEGGETDATSPGLRPSQPRRRDSNADSTPQQPLANYTLETDLYRISFSNQGGTVRSWLLTEKDAKALSTRATTANRWT